MEFKTAESFYKWLARNHDKADEVWIKIHKVGSGLKSITPKEAVDVALCFGWIDAVRKSLDDKSFLQRYTPRGRKSIWSKINIDNVARLVGEGRMTEHGLREVEAAKADGRWDAAYSPPSRAQVADDFMKALRKNKKASAAFAGLSPSHQREYIEWITGAKTEATRARRLDTAIGWIADGKGRNWKYER